MHTTDNVLFLLDGRSIYYRATHTHTYAERKMYNAFTYGVFKFRRIMTDFSINNKSSYEESK